MVKCVLGSVLLKGQNVQSSFSVIGPFYRVGKFFNDNRLVLMVLYVERTHTHGFRTSGLAMVSRSHSSEL